MDYVKPNEVVRTMLGAGAAKAGLPPRDLLIRGFLSGALLGFATSLALTVAAQTNLPIAGALVFPAGFAMIVLLGLELITGSFALVPLAGVDGRRPWGKVGSSLAWLLLGNLAGSVAYAWLLCLALTSCGAHPAAGIGPKIVAAAEAKTNGYLADGAAGWMTAFVKGVLCNWMVCLGVVLAMTSRSTLGKIAACWLPIVTFFAQGFEHSVVNMFLIPAGMMLGAKVSLANWWVWNQVPVTLGNFAGGLLFTGLFLYWTYRSEPAAAPAEAPEPLAEAAPARA
jgi:formate/nitrite transporter